MPDTGAAGRAIVMIAGSRGNLCTGTAIARDLVLTAAHCVAPASTYRVLLAREGPALSIGSIVVHPRFDAAAYAKSRATADLALLKLAEPLPARIAPAPVGPGLPTARGDRLVIAGFGVADPSRESGVGVARSASLVATGQPGSLQIRLVDPSTRNERAGLGACTGDSGGPAFSDGGGRLSLIGVVSWSTGPGNSAGCGGLTGVTPLTLHRSWIADTARKLGSPIVWH